jgi:uncharacterized repeat protein (TIGR01451 family)
VNRRRRAGTLLALALWLVATSGADATVTPGGTVIENQAEAVYGDGSGHRYHSFSNDVDITVAAVGSLVVSPKERGCRPQSDDFSLGSPLVRNFTIANTSNITDAYTIPTARTSAGSLTSVAFLGPNGPIPVTLGHTVSPNVAPGSALAVQVTIATAGIAAGSDVELALAARTTVRGTSDGLQTDHGEQCGIAVAGAVFGGPGGASRPVQKLVDQVPFLQSAPNARVHYAIAFKDYGGSPAARTTLSDPLPARVAPDLTTVRFDGDALPRGSVTLTNGLLVASLGDVAPGGLHTVTFDATIGGAAPLGAALINVATLRADNAPDALSSPAIVLLGTANIVYDGNVGAGAPLAGATVSLIDPLTHAPVAPAALTGSAGTYQFALGEALLGTLQQPAVYDLTVGLPGYRSRRLHVVLTPNSGGTTYALEETALDGQALASPGGFALVPGPIHYAALHGLFGNLPIFPQRDLSISKIADRAAAALGDRVVFTLQFGNAGPDPLDATRIVDTLPPGLIYAPHTARLDGVPDEPVREGSQLVWSLPKLDTTHALVYATVVSQGATPGANVTNVASIAAYSLNDPKPLTARADASVAIVGGVLDGRITITGRVYLDRNESGRFDRGDWGLSGVRIYLEDGESVVTDDFGRFTFPAARPGIHVLRLDESTLPPATRAYDQRALDSERSTERLVHGVLDAYTLQDVNFAIRPGAR